MPWRVSAGMWQGLRPRRYTSSMVRTATIAERIGVFAARAVLAVLFIGWAPARADSLRDLGDAFRAYDAGDLPTARAKLARVEDGSDARLPIADYVLWLRGMVALRSGEPTRAEMWFQRLAKLALPVRSPFARELPWRLADCAWDRGDRQAAAAGYHKALAAKDALDIGDAGTAMYRIAETRTGGAAIAPYRALVIAHPAHPLALRAEHKLAALGAPPLTALERIERARHLSDAH